MRIKSRDKEGIKEADLTPMIDMTFQLIAFFMVLINFTQTENDARVKLPSSTLAKPPDQPLEDTIILHVAQDGSVVYAGNLLPTFERLRPYLVAEADQLVATDKSPSDATIIIRAHKNAKTGRVQELIQVCQEEQFEKFALRALEDVGN